MATWLLMLHFVYDRWGSWEAKLYDWWWDLGAETSQYDSREVVRMKESASGYFAAVCPVVIASETCELKHCVCVRRHDGFEY